MSDQLYAVPVSHAARTGSQRDRLREELGEAEAAASREKDWTQKTRLDQHAKSLRRELNAAELAATHNARREKAEFDRRYAAANVEGPQYAVPVAYFQPPREPKMKLAGNKAAASGPANAVAANALAAMKRRDAAAA